jgi:hypothetical protein
MTDRSWIGGFHRNDARSPHNWSPDGAPQPGDILSMSGGTMNIAGNDLRYDQLNIPGSSTQATTAITLNMSDHAHATVDAFAFSNPVTINIRGTDWLNLSDMEPPFGFSHGPVTVNLAQHAELIGSFNMRFEHLAISGGDHTKYVNNGTDSLIGSSAVIGPDVLGHGTFVVQSQAAPGIYYFPASLEFGGFVSAGQTVELTGLAFSFRIQLDATLKLDDPMQFHGTVDLHDHSLADLVGLAKADSWSYKNDLLAIKSVCGKVIDRLYVISDASVPAGSPHGLSVSMSAAGDVLVKPGSDFHGVIALPTS